MKKHMLFTLGLLLASPLVLAQDNGGTPAKPATPALPAVPAPGTPPTVTPPTTDDSGNTSTGIRSQNGGIGATANKDKKSGTISADFAAMDANGDGSISRDEFGTTSGQGSFEQLDKNHDGKLSAVEMKGSTKDQGNSNSAKPSDSLPRR